MDPSERTVESVMKIHRMMKLLATELRKDVKVLTDPTARIIFESAANSIERSIKALLDFERENLPDLRSPAQ